MYAAARAGETISIGGWLWLIDLLFDVARVIHEYVSLARLASQEVCAGLFMNLYSKTLLRKITLCKDFAAAAAGYRRLYA